MPEPTSTSTGVAIAAGTITLTGSVVGLGYDVLFAAFVGALFALTLFPEMPRWRLALTVVTTALIAAWLAPVFAAALPATFVWARSVSNDSLRLASAGVLGATTQSLLPVLLSFAKNRAGGAS